MRGTVNRDSATAVCERIRRAVEQCAFKFNGQIIPVTISLGLCYEIEREGKTLDSLIRKADTALYKAKNGGRNRIEIFAEKEKSSIEDTVA